MQGAANPASRDCASCDGAYHGDMYLLILAEDVLDHEPFNALTKKDIDGREISTCLVSSREGGSMSINSTDVPFAARRKSPVRDRLSISRGWFSDAIAYPPLGRRSRDRHNRRSRKTAIQGTYIFSSHTLTVLQRGSLGALKSFERIVIFLPASARHGEASCVDCRID